MPSNLPGSLGSKCQGTKMQQLTKLSNNHSWLSTFLTLCSFHFNDTEPHPLDSRISLTDLLWADIFSSSSSVILCSLNFISQDMEKTKDLPNSFPPSDECPSERHFSNESLSDESVYDEPVSHEAPFDEALRDEFQNLRTEWDTMPTNFDGCTKWIEDLEIKRGSDYVDRFVLWMQQNPNPKLLFLLEEVTDEEFESSLKRADWLGDKKALGEVNARLWSPKISSVPDFYLGFNKEWHLLVRLNGRALSPRESDITTYESYGISSVNPHMLLGVRYKPLDQMLRDQEMLFVTLGKLICAYFKARCEVM
jgi:hypothetical protein